MSALSSTQSETDLLELIRRQVFGSTVSSNSFDFNTIFNPEPMGSGVGILDTDSSGSDPGPNPNVANADPAVASAVIGMAMSATLGMLGVPGLSTVVGKSVNNSQIENMLTIAEALGLVNPMDAAFSVADDAAQSISLAQDTAEAISFANENEGSSGAGTDGGNGIGGPAQGSNDGPGDTPGDSGGTTGDDGNGNDGDSGGSTGDGDAYHNGGFVTGEFEGQEVDIKAKAGELVIPIPIVQMLGRNFFEKILLTESPIVQAAEKASKEASKSKGAK